MIRTLAVLVIVVASFPAVGAEEEAVARTDRWSITEGELEQWSEVLRHRRAYKELADRPEDARRWLAEEVAASRLALEDYGFLVPAAERDVIWRRLQASEERRWWTREVLRPQVVVSEDEARLIFETHRDGYRKAEGVVLQEIFLWAPADLQAYRAEKRRLADRLHAEIGDAERFSAEAMDHSDATSRLVGGRIGTVLRDLIPEVLARRLFTGELGLTEVIASRDGFYLFWVGAFRPPKDNSFADVADQITARLELQQLEELKIVAYGELEQRYGLEVSPAPYARRTGLACHLEGDWIELSEMLPDGLRLDDDRLATAIDRLCSQELIRRDLERLGSCPTMDPLVAFDAEVAGRILDRLATAGVEASTNEDDAPLEEVQTAERWTFEVLEVAAAGRPRLFYEVLRIEHDLGGNPSPQEIQLELEERLGLEASIRRHQSVTVHEAAGLGPEIHRTLKKHLEPGQTSRPLVIAEGPRIAVVRLLDRETVEVVQKRSSGNSGTLRQGWADDEVRRRLLEGSHFVYGDEEGAGLATGP